MATVTASCHRVAAANRSSAVIPISCSRVIPIVVSRSSRRGFGWPTEGPESMVISLVVCTVRHANITHSGRGQTTLNVAASGLTRARGARWLATRKQTMAADILTNGGTRHSCKARASSPGTKVQRQASPTPGSPNKPASAGQLRGFSGEQVDQIGSARSLKERAWTRQ